MASCQSEGAEPERPIASLCVELGAGRNQIVLLLLLLLLFPCGYVTLVREPCGSYYSR